MNAHTKVRNAATAVILSVGVVLSALLTAFPVQASATAGGFGQFVTAYHLTVKDSHEDSHTYFFDKDSSVESWPEIAIKDGTEVELDMDISVPDYMNVTTDRPYTMQLPAALSAQGAQSGPLSDFAAWTVDEHGLLSVTFNSTVNDGDREGRDGGFRCNSTFSAADAGGDSHTFIPFTISGATVNVPVRIYYAEVSPTLEKTGALSADKQSVLWKVTVTSGNDGSNGGLKDVVVKDSLGTANQTFADFAEDPPRWGPKGDATDPVVQPADTEYSNIPCYEKTDDGHFVFYLGDMDHDETMYLTFASTPKPDAELKPQFPDTDVVYHNTAELVADDRVDGPGYTKDAQVTDDSKTAVWIKKSVDPANIVYNGRRVTSIPWKITVNEGSRGNIGGGAVITDDLQDPLKLDETAGIYVEDADGSNRTKITTTDGGGFYYEYTGADAGGYGGTITIHCPAVSGEKHITFTTDVDPDWYETANQKSISNGAAITLDGEGPGGHPPIRAYTPNF